MIHGLAARRPGRFNRPQRRLRAGLVQLLFAVAGLGLGLLLPRITAEPTVASSRVTDALVGVGFGVLGLVSIIFSLLFLVVQWAFSSLSPRLNLFRDDPIVWRTFGLAVNDPATAVQVRQSPITWRLHRAEELASGNFPAIWRHAAGSDTA